MLKPLLLFSPAVLLLAFVPAPSGQKPTHAKPAAPEAAPPAIISVEPPRPDVKQVYKIDCAMCHGDTGDGKTDLAKSMNLTLLDWTNAASLTGKTDQQLIEMIRKGNDKMPPEDASRATDEQVKGLVKYIRSFAGQTPAPAPTPAAAPGAAPSTNPTGTSPSASTN